MKRKIFLYLILSSVITTTTISCSSSKKTVEISSIVNRDDKQKKSRLIEEKTGAQLWGESCIRCHNIPPPQAYNDEQWVVLGQHMRIRANINNDEINKIVEFIKNSN